MNYYEIIAASHSECKQLEANYQPPAHVFELGQLVHGIMEGKPVPDAIPLAIKMATALLVELRPNIKGETVRLEWEIYRIIGHEFGETIWEKAKVDLLVPGKYVLDYKTAKTCKTQAQFQQLAINAGYFEQLARYMCMARVQTGFIWGVNENGKVFKLMLKRSDLDWQQYYDAYQAANARWVAKNYGQF